ncbi:TIGR03067 domain-containing protein [bacterium]|jgi:uncharacterized protein (TIGR03067 family)|nr:TIGR03067 domain-containing protein [Verrucomicrobiota bacterium]MDA7500240.1 TIGR03067 domain-containing protein [bacterium]MDA7657556.1 TIGR03067 domain-containing protein [Verrucomicrobiota bacterium]MDA7866402.1 TIGR03067 domain-containing protein [Verrucomicrobiota bacterium]
MKRTLYFVFALAIQVALFADNTNDMKEELSALEGTWKAIAMEAGGNPFPKESVPDFTFIVTASGKSTSKSPFGNYQSTISAEPNINPKTIDNLHDTGDQKGKKQYGIYKQEGDTWTVCMTPPGHSKDDRPKDFNTTGTANVVFVFNRNKEDKKP